MNKKIVNACILCLIVIVVCILINTFRGKKNINEGFVVDSNEDIKRSLDSIQHNSERVVEFFIAHNCVEDNKDIDALISSLSNMILDIGIMLEGVNDVNITEEFKNKLSSLKNNLGIFENDNIKRYCLEVISDDKLTTFNKNLNSIHDNINVILEANDVVEVNESNFDPDKMNESGDDVVEDAEGPFDESIINTIGQEFDHEILNATINNLSEKVMVYYENQQVLFRDIDTIFDKIKSYISKYSAKIPYGNDVQGSICDKWIKPLKKINRNVKELSKLSGKDGIILIFHDTVQRTLKKYLELKLSHLEIMGETKVKDTITDNIQIIY